jgi:DNA-binding response OmpR family regulator
MRVLIVDDEPLMLRATARALRTRGWEVDTASSAADTLIRENHDVVLTDWDPHGPSVLAYALMVKTPVVVYTADPDKAMAEIVTHTGEVIRVVTKPFEIDELADALSDAIFIEMQTEEARS